MDTRQSFPAFAIAPLALLVLSGCATTPQLPCRFPTPPADLMQPAPPEGSFREGLDLTLDLAFIPKPTEPTP